MTLKKIISAQILSAGWRHVLGETLLIATVGWMLLLYLQQQSAYTSIFSQGTLPLIPLCALYAALRLRISDSSLADQAKSDLLFAAGLTASLTFVVGATVLLLSRLIGSYFPDGTDVIVMLSLLLFGGVFFVLSRIAIRVWMFWDELQRKHLVWSLTHAHLVLVVTLSALFALLIVLPTGLTGIINYLAYSDGVPTPELIAQLIIYALPILGIYIVATGIVLVIVLPPSVLFSYIVSRRTTRRLAKLTGATEAIRAGNYGARIEVEGEDEVARLQIDFNAMSSDLQGAIRAVRAERDTVAALSQSQRELVAGVSHELRTPVATLRGYIETTLSGRSGPLPPEVQHDLEIMDREVLRLQALIDDLFTVSRAEAGKLPLRLAPTDVGELARRLVDTAAPLVWRSSRVQLLAEVAELVPLARADVGRLEQVLSNLIHNAVRHTPAGGLVAVVVAAERNGVIVRVQDTGEGIAPEDMPSIFERFYRAGGASSPDSGAGLGLALVKELTEAMGGSVAVESRLGEGTLFTLRLLPYEGNNAASAGGVETVLLAKSV